MHTQFLNSPISRRRLLAGASATVALSACGGGGLQPERLQARFPDGFRAPTHAVVDAGPQRFPFVIIANDQLPMIDDVPETLEMEITMDGALVETIVVSQHGVGQFTPYFPLVFTPPSAGRYVITPDFGGPVSELIVEERDAVNLFQVGDTLPAFDTPTFINSHGVDPICSRSVPCPFHEITLTEALANDKPTALLIATPAWCQTDVCGPVVDFLIDEASARDDLNVIHAEVYESGVAGGTGFPALAPLLVEWGITFEPSIFLANPDGEITDIRHFAFDRSEVATVIGNA